MSYSRLRPTFTFTEDRLAELQAVVPEAFADGRINWETLRDVLNPFVEDEGPDAEHYGLFWPGKREARRLAAMPSRGALHPSVGEGVNEDATRNIFIEGDNLEVLKLLLKSYAGRVKMIYIDPPYNTGNDVIYRDTFAQTLDEYLVHTGQVDEVGAAVTTNTRAEGRFHSNWLNMMYPRLRLARALLEDNGVIFVSIDDNEQYHLRLLLNEVFGEEAFAGTFVWQAKKGGGSDNSGVVADQEYVLSYTKLEVGNALSRIAVKAEALDKIDEKGPYRRGRELNKWGANSRREDRPTMYFPILGPNGEDVYPIRNDGAEGCWRWGKSKMHAIVARGDVEFARRDDGTYIVYEKIRHTDPRSKPYRTWLENVGTTADGSKTVKELFGGTKVFDFAKPIGLLKQLVKMGTGDNGDMVMDFFAGSCSIAQAVLELNREDGGERQFVCIQLPEATPVDSEARKAGYMTIAAIGKERIRRVIQQMSRDKNLPTLLDDRESPEDLGFKAFRLTPSDVRPWQDYNGTDLSTLESLLAAAETPLVEGWSAQDVLTEVMLLQGYPLDSRIVRDGGLTANSAVRVTSEACGHALYVCLDARITSETVQQIHLDRNDVFVCLDSALSDESKMRLADVCNLQTI